MSIHYGKNIKTRYFKGYINNVFTVGSPTFDGSVVSGFSTVNNYLLIPGIPTNTTDFEIVLKVKFSNSKAQQHFFNTSYQYSLLLSVLSDGKLTLYMSTNGSSWNLANAVKGTSVLSNDTWYYIKCSFNGAEYKIQLSTDCKTWINEITIQSTSTLASVGGGRIGCGWHDSPSSYIAFDLSQCYVNINGKRWWDNLKRRKYDYNFTVVGTPSISNAPSCEVSGFSTSNCLTIDLPSSITSSEYFFKIKTGDSVTSPTNQLISSHKSPNTWLPAVRNGKICVYNGSWQTGVTTVTPNTTYFIKSVFDGSQWVLYSSTDNESWTTEFTWTTTTNYAGTTLYIGRDYDTTGEYFGGSIDLTQSYIKINGELWWSCFKQSDDYVFSEESTSSDYDYTVFEDGEIKSLFNGKLHKTTYYKYTYEDWVQPVLTSDTSHGTLTTTGYVTWNPWRAFDGIKASGENKYLSNSTAKGDITWKTPEPIRIKSCEVYTTTEGSYLNRFPQTITVYGSDDGVDWVKIGSLSGYTQPASGGSVTVPCNASKVYAYSKWEFGPVFSGGSGGVAVSEIVITAQKQIGYKESTSGDYDFSETYKGQIVLAYKGKDLIYSVYPVNGTVFEQSTAGTYTFTPLATGSYEISLVGPGSGGACAGDQPSYASKSRGAGGGSGSYVCGVWKLTGGTPYTIVVGAGGPAGPTNSNNGYSSAAGDSSFGDFIVCGGGGGATAVWKGSAIGGAAGMVKTCTGYNRLITSTAGKQGSAGGSYTYYAGGESVLPPYGAGGSGQATGNYAGKTYPGTDGHCKIRFLVE